MPSLVPTAWTVRSNLETPADSWSAELASAALLRTLHPAIPVSLLAGLAETDGTPILREILAGGVIDTRSASWTGSALAAACSGRDAIARLMDTQIRMRFERLPAAEPIAEDPTAYDPTEVFRGHFTARQIAQALFGTRPTSLAAPLCAVAGHHTTELGYTAGDLFLLVSADLRPLYTAPITITLGNTEGTVLTIWQILTIVGGATIEGVTQRGLLRISDRVNDADAPIGTAVTLPPPAPPRIAPGPLGDALELVWLAPDYMLLDTFDAQGRALDVLRALIEPFQSSALEPYRVDLYARGNQIIVKQRDLEPVADLTLSIRDARVETFSLEVERLPLIRHVRLEGAPRVARPDESPAEPSAATAVDAARAAADAAAAANVAAQESLDAAAASDEAAQLAAATAKAEAQEAEEAASAAADAAEQAALLRRKEAEIAFSEATRLAEIARQEAIEARIAAAAAAEAAADSDPPDAAAIAAADAAAIAAADAAAAAEAAAEANAIAAADAGTADGPVALVIDADGTGHYLPGSRTTTEVNRRGGNTVVIVTSWQLPEQIVTRQTQTTADEAGRIVEAQEIENDWTATQLDQTGAVTAPPLPRFARTTIRTPNPDTGALRVSKRVTVEYTYDSRQFLKGEISTTDAYSNAEDALLPSEMEIKVNEASGSLLAKTITTRFSWNQQKATWVQGDRTEQTAGGHLAGGPGRGSAGTGLTLVRPADPIAGESADDYDPEVGTLDVGEVENLPEPPFTLELGGDEFVVVGVDAEGDLILAPLDPETVSAHPAGTPWEVTGREGELTAEDPITARGLVPVRVEFDLSNDPTAEDLEYVNPRLPESALRHLGLLIARAHGRWRHRISTSGVPIPGVRRGTRILFTGLVDAEGEPIALEPALVLDVSERHGPEEATMALDCVFWKESA